MPLLELDGAGVSVPAPAGSDPRSGPAGEKVLLHPTSLRLTEQRIGIVGLMVLLKIARRGIRAEIVRKRAPFFTPARELFLTLGNEAIRVLWGLTLVCHVQRPCLRLASMN